MVGLPRRNRDPGTRDKGPKDRPILWTPKLADPRSPIRANYPSRSYSLRGNVHPANLLSLLDFLDFRRNDTKLISNSLVFERLYEEEKEFILEIAIQRRAGGGGGS